MDVTRILDNYLTTKKDYVSLLNTAITTQPNLWNDVIENNFDRADKSMGQGIIVRQLSESSKNLEEVYFKWADDTKRRNIAMTILSPSDPDNYLVKPPLTSSSESFLLIRKYDLPFIRDFLKMEIINKGIDDARGFTALNSSELFNKILKIEGDKFVLHSGVDQFFGKVFGKGDRAQHCPLIVSLIQLMTLYHIPFDSSRPEVQKCQEREQQKETEFEYATVPVDDDTVFVHVPSDTSAPPLPKGWRYTLDPVTGTPIWVENSSGTVRYNPPPPNGNGGRRTKKCKLSNRMKKKRVTRNRKTRKSLRKH
jgi:hypothetical protein